MFCKYCGKFLNSKNCIYCGNKNDKIGLISDNLNLNLTESGDGATVANGESYQEPTYSNNQTQPQYGMKWFKFIIYFSLFANALMNILTGVLQISGMYYSVAGVRSELVYEYYPNLKIVDIVFGIAYIGLAVFAIVTRFQLARFKKNGPTLLYAVLAIEIAVQIIYLLIGQKILGESLLDSSTISSLVSIVVLLIINIVYFRKRQELFVN